LAILLIIGIPAVLFVSTFHIKKLEVVGAQRYTPEQITEHVMQTKKDSNALYLYLKYHYFTNVKIPFVEKIDIDMVDSHTVTIFVYEKMVAGCVEFMGEYLYFDKDGIVVESSSKRLEDIPIIKGLQFNKIILNEKLELQKNEFQKNEVQKDEVQTDDAQKEETQKDEDQINEDQINEDQMNEVQKNELFDVIINLTQLVSKYDLGVDTISFNNKYEVTVDCGDIKVLLGKKSTYDEVLSELKNILSETEGMQFTIDMRNYVKGTDKIIAKPKKPTE
jgi:cell division protein FtsQ